MRFAVWIFATAYGLALASLALGVSGAFGTAKDPLSAIFLLPLGLPWNVALDRAGLDGTLALVAAPAVNLILLLVVWRWLRRRKA